MTTAPPPRPLATPRPLARQAITLGQPGAPVHLDAPMLDAATEWQRALDAGLIGTPVAMPPAMAEACLAMEAMFRRAGLCRNRC